MKKEFHSSIDGLRLRKQKEGTLIQINGWCFHEKEADRSIRLYINGQEVPCEILPITRYDVAGSFPKFQVDPHVGFMVKANSNAYLESLEIKAAVEGREETILKLNGRDISRFLDKEVIEYSIDVYSEMKDENMAVLVGWALDEANSQFSYSIVDEKNVEVPSTVRIETRRDLVQLKMIDSSQSMCGFRINFPVTKDGVYQLKIVGDTSTRTVPIKRELKKRDNLWISYLKAANPQRIYKAYEYLKNNGVRGFMKRLSLGPGSFSPYPVWFERQRITAQQLEEQKRVEFSYTPKISLIVATYNTKESYLKEMIDSVLNQSYSNWELCIADGSSNEKVAKYIASHYGNDKRIKLKRLDKNYGISGNMNAALEMATGDYLGLYDHDDFLEYNALYEVVNVLQNQKYDVVYTDEDKYDDSKGVFADPNFKPDFNIDLFRSHNYITHFFVVNMDIVKRIGGMKKEYDGAQDYDFMFRVFEQTNKIYHLPKMLYHWRMHSLSTAMNPESKMYCYEAGKNAILDHYKRIGLSATVKLLPKPYYGCYETTYATPGNPLVSVVIPNMDHRDVLKTCVDSLFEINTYKNIEIIIVENNSRESETFTYYQELERAHPNVKIVYWKDDFNYSKINNFGVQYAKGDYILFLNNDTEMIRPDSIQNMLGVCMRNEVGAVGAKLLYDDRTIQHAGVVIGFSGYAVHINNGIDEDQPGYMMRAQLNCDYSAVTAACMMVKKSVFEKVDGFDPQFKVACNDVDLCLKIRELGYLVVYDAFSIWFHYESKSRGYEDSEEKIERFNNEVAKFQKKWGKILTEGDPYYNPNFKIELGPFIYL
ncbi:glycosyltransferase family 2 protein [uncultured Dubosiella sp.]|uniref:glycosyltransferase family 2 protein n=2 Tax=uncultured Dubosiella sp. TaxID=1937011 RepID=UPI002731F12C|nr:glycosyltransferase family 2 protein [uncultured Dubosiella sp.]